MSFLQFIQSISDQVEWVAILVNETEWHQVPVAPSLSMFEALRLWGPWHDLPPPVAVTWGWERVYQEQTYNSMGLSLDSVLRYHTRPAADAG